MLVHVSVFSMNYGGKGTAERETPRVCTHTHITLTVQARIVWITVGGGEELQSTERRSALVEREVLPHYWHLCMLHN